MVAKVVVPNQFQFHIIEGACEIVNRERCKNPVCRGAANRILNEE